MSRRAARLTIVTGADARYYRSLWQFLCSARRHGLDAAAHLVVYDLGLTPVQRFRLDADRRIELRTFQFGDYPPHVNLTTYAWKPIVVADVVEQARGAVLWLDSATIVLAPIGRIESEIAARGLYTPYGGAGPIGDRTHPDAAVRVGIEARELALRARSAGICGFDGRRPAVRELVAEWRRLALVEGCIAPPGATWHNHRFEQSLLTVLLDRAAVRHGFELTDDAIDVSARWPLPELSTRNKVARWVPEWADPVAWRYFVLRRQANLLWLRVSAALGANPA